MKLRLEPHEIYPVLTEEEVMGLWMTSRYKLRVGMELEYNYLNYEDRANLNTEQVLGRIKDKFKERHGFEMATQKNGKTAKIIKRSLKDQNTGQQWEDTIAVPCDGFIEHAIAPYAYPDGSVAIEVVMSPEILLVKDIAVKVEKIDKVVEEVDPELIQSPNGSCGLHQTLVFEHLEKDMPQIVVANVVQIVRAYMPGLIYLSASGTVQKPTREMNCRGFMRSVWREPNLRHIQKFSLVYPRYRNSGYWGIEFRYPDGTNSFALAGAVAVVNAAIFLKAVNLSQFGLLQVSDWSYRESKVLIEKFVAGLMENQDWEAIKAQAAEIINFVSDQLTEIDPRAYAILKKIENKPVFTLAQDESNIKRSLYREFDKILEENPLPDETMKLLEKNIELDNSMGLGIKEAKKRLARKVGVKYTDVTALLDKHNIAWDEGLQKFAKVQKELF